MPEMPFDPAQGLKHILTGLFIMVFEPLRELAKDGDAHGDPVRTTDILLEVDAALSFTDAFNHLRTGVACGDRIGLLNGRSRKG